METLRSVAVFRRSMRDRRARYMVWFDQQALSPEQRTVQAALADALTARPLLSVLIPTYNTQPQHLRECLDSVVNQTYTNWEICIADDASTDQLTKDVISEYADRYENIRAIFSETNNHIAISSNNALAMARGEFISLLDHDDLLQPNALYETVSIINSYPAADLIYSDEDKLESDEFHVEPFFKPDWSPDLLYSCNYITHFATLSRRIMNQVGGFREGTEGAQDWDLFLRVTALTSEIHHISKILYTWRKSATSTAQSAASKPYAYINQGKVLRHVVGARHENAYVDAAPDRGFWRVRRVIKGTPSVTVVIPTKDNLKFISQCLDSILDRSSYPYFEVVVVDTGSTDPRVEAYYAKALAANPELKIVRWEGPFNFSGACNLGVEKSTGDYVLFLNDDTELISNDWIQGLLEHAQRPEVGMVGAQLLFAGGEIQHAGVVLSERDVAFHPFYGRKPHFDMSTYIFASNVRNTAAVTAACSMVSRKKFDEVGGFDEALRVTYNDVDLCLRLLSAGYVNVYNPFVHLYHYESVSVGKITGPDRDQSEFEEAKLLMKKRWGHFLRNDPYYNSSFEQHGPGYILPV